MGSGVIPPPRSPEKSLMGLLGGSTDLNLDLDFSNDSFIGGLDLGGVVGGNRAPGAGGFGGFNEDHGNTGLGNLADPPSESPLFGMPAFSLFGSSPAEPPPQHLLTPAPISAPPALPQDMSFSRSNELVDNGLFGNPNTPSLPSDLLGKSNSPATLPGLTDAPPGLGGLKQNSSFDDNNNAALGLDNLICQFSCRCAFLNDASIGSVKIHSPQLEEPFVMERAHFDESTWLACVSVPRAHVTFRYKYFVENQLGIQWEEDRQHRIVFLKTDSQAISNDDTIESGIVT